MSLPRPIFDHLVINARERLDAAETCYRELGFHLTPRGYHTLGSINHCAAFGTDYLELVGIGTHVPKPRIELLRFPEGLNGIVFATDDAAGLYATLAAVGAPVHPPTDFSRPVQLADGMHEARFRTVQVKAEAAPYGRVYFCQHFTPDLVWRDEWRSHPNGVTGFARAVILAVDPDKSAALYRQLFGAEAVKPARDGFSLAVGNASLDILTKAWDVSAEGDDRLLGLSLHTRGAKRLIGANDAFGAIVELID
jgi:catechol 2,3-dioxygenase-like lactoylglutathione lyase family enzyme